MNPRATASAVDAYKGQYISAGYTGHGMPRAFAWWVLIPQSIGRADEDESYYSAEAVAGMILADMRGKKWSPPDWFPVHYLTTKAV